MDKAAAAGVDANMAGFIPINAEKQQVAGADGVQGHGRAGAELVTGRAGHIQTVSGVHIMDKAAAIKALSWAAAAIAVRCTELLPAETNQPLYRDRAVRLPGRWAGDNGLLRSTATGRQQYECEQYKGQGVQLS